MEFVPSKKQIDLLSAMLDMEVPSTVKGICEHVGISRTTYYEWFKDNDFTDWFDHNYKKQVTQYVAMLDRIGLEKAKDDFKYWEAMQIKYGSYAKYKKLEPSVLDM